jgi:signal transduction histidine kinase
MLAHAPGPGAVAFPRTARARLAALEDLQQRFLAEDATRKALLNAMGEGVALWGRDGEVLEANPAAESLWGRVPGLQEVLDAGRVDGGFPTTVRRERRDLSVDLTELDFGSLALIRDVSAEKRLERQRREMQRMVSHELKTPLSSIAGFGETIERYQLSAEELAKVASMIRGEAGRLQEMVTVFLDLERLGSGHWDDETESIDLGSLVEARLKILESAAARRNLAITAEIQPGCSTRGVRSLLDRVIDNLVGNAIKYADPATSIHVGVHRDGAQSVVSVRDHGPGIAADFLEKVFDRFYRVPGSRGSGTGLGLALVQEVVDWHGGCITIDSTPGAGSTFSVSLPHPEEA